MIDWAALGRLGFAPDVALFAPGAEDPVFGFVVCRAASCDQVVHSGSLGLCWRCGQLWQKAGQGADFEVFCATVPGRTRHNRGGVLCRVCRTPGHERPVRAHGLCTMCSKTMANRGQSPDEYVNGDAEYEAAVPRRTFGRCLVTVCDRWGMAQPAAYLHRPGIATGPVYCGLTGSVSALGHASLCSLLLIGAASCERRAGSRGAERPRKRRRRRP